jgi:hypothetical protein
MRKTIQDGYKPNEAYTHSRLLLTPPFKPYLVREDYRFVHRKRAKEWYDVSLCHGRAEENTMVELALLCVK